MAGETSEIFSKNRSTEFTPGPSLRPSTSIVKSVILDKFGFLYENRRNSAIRIKCHAGESIKIIHKDNGGKCHLGVPNFDGKIYIFVHFAPPSSGSINYGFSDKVIYVHNTETPDLLIPNSSDLIFVCIDHDESISIRNVQGNDEILQEVDPPSFARSSRCWMFSARDSSIGSVLKYNISSKSNSGGSILVAEASSKNSIPWWNLHGVRPFNGQWKVCLNENIKCHVSERSDDNKKVPSFSGDVIYINEIEQPRLLSFCEDVPNWTAFAKDQNIGDFTLYQDANNNIKIYESETYLSFNCDKANDDPYDPYGQDRINFEGTNLYYYGSKDAKSGEVIHVSRNGWNFENICGVRPYQSGFVEYIKFDSAGSHVVSCEDFGYSGYFFHVHVSEPVAANPEVSKSGSAVAMSKIAQSGISIWVNGEVIDSSNGIYRFLNIDKTYTEGLSGEILQERLYNKILDFIYDNRILSNDFICISLNVKEIGSSDIVFINNAIKDAANSKGVYFAYDYSLLDLNKANIIERSGSNFFFDISNGLVSKYPSSLIENGIVYINTDIDDHDSKIKEVLVMGAKKLIIGGLKVVAEKAINSINSFVHPLFNGSYKYHCRRKTSFADQVDVLPLSSKVDNVFKNDPVYSTQYAGLEIFREVMNFSSSGTKNCFLLPNGEWKFPHAKFANWNFSDEIRRDIQDAVVKIYNDFNVKIGFSIHSKSLQENEKNFKLLCRQVGIENIMILDASFLSNSELVDMHQRLSLEGFDIYLEGSPHTITEGMLSSSFCLGNWIWLKEYRGRMPLYFKGIIREA